MALTACLNCGTAVRGEHDVCPECGAEQPPPEDIRRMPHQVVLTFVALGLQHSPANMAYFSLGLIHGHVGTDAGTAIAWSIAPKVMNAPAMKASASCLPRADFR